MATQNAGIDANSRQTLTAFSVANDGTIVDLWANPITHALLIEDAGSGTVTSVSVVTGNGFAGSVATATSTPAITLSTTITGLIKGDGTAISAATAGTDYVTGSSTNTFTNKTYDTAGSGNSFSINGVAATANTGTGSVVRASSPTLVTPALGVATATSLNGATITTTTSGTLTLANSSTLATSGANSITLTSTGSTNVTLPTTGTLATLAGSEELTNKTLTSSVGKGTWTASGTWTLPAITAGGVITLAENSAIALDPAGSADGKYTGTTVTATAGYTQAFGDLVYLDPTDSRWELCDANSAQGADGDSRGIIGMVVVAGTDGSSCTILLNGIIRADAKFPTFTVNNPIYVSETAGSVTQTQPSTSDVVIRVVGFGITGDEMYFSPSADYITHV